MVPIELLHDRGPGLELGLSLPKSHGAAQHARVVLGHLDDYRMRGVGVDLSRVGPLHLEDIPGELDDRALKTWSQCYKKNFLRKS